ncbi:MAG TPA: hypothetical protein VMT43_04425 [Acidimicrobiales bacterium]|nr:hypothetical protein [Acidimicrobiales bacterium]
MTAPATPGAPAAPAEPAGDVAPVGQRWRKVLVAFLVVLTSLAILASAVGVWAHRTLLNTDSWVATVGPLAKDPAVTDAVATKVTDEVMQALDLEGWLKETLPPKVKPAAAPIAAGASQFVLNAVKQLLQTDQFQKFWVAANRQVHELAVKVLRGDTKYVSTTGGVVSFNYLPLVAKALAFVESKDPGIAGTSGTVPDITSSTPPDQARSELSSALGHTLPDDFGVVTVFKSDQLKAAQVAVRLFDMLVVVLLIVTLVLIVVTIALAPNRRRTIIYLGLGMVVAFVIANAIINALKDQIVGLVGGAEARAAAKATIQQLINRLDLITYSLAVLGLVVALVAFLTGGTRIAKLIRAEAARAGRALVGTASGDTVPRGVRWVHAHTVELRWAALAVTLLLLFFVVSGWVGLFVTLLVFALVEAGVSYVGTRQWPEAGAPAS